MKIIKVGILLFASLVFIQCSQNVVTDDIPSLFPLDQSAKVTDLNPHIDKIEFIQLEENENSLLTYVSKLLIDRNGNFIVLDISGTVKAFDSKGKFLFNIGRKGRGPGEYLSAKDISLDNTSNNIFVLSLGSVHVYNVSNGEFVRHIQTPKEDYEAMCVSGDGGFFLFSANPGPADLANFNKDFFALSSFDAEGNLEGKFLPRKDFVISQGVFTQSYDKNYLLRPQEGDNILYKIAGNEIEPQFHIDFGNRTIPGKYMFQGGENPWANIQKFIRADYYKLPIYFQDTESQLYFACAGPNGNYNHFLYSLPETKAIHWEDTFEDQMPVLIMASDSKNLYAMVVDIDRYLESFEDSLNPLIREVIRRFSQDKIEVASGNPVLAKIRFNI